jgi:hypothetical protein
MSFATRDSSERGRTNLRAIMPEAAESMAAATTMGKRKPGPCIHS